VNVSVDINAAKALLRLDKGYKRMLNSIVYAVNDTGRATQAAVQQRVREQYTVRKPFVINQVKFIQASVKLDRWEARVGIGIGKPPGGSPLLLPQFELGGTRKGVKGGAVAVPVVGGARPSQPSSIPDSLFIQRLALRRPARGRPKKNAKAVKAGTLVRKGLLGTYQVAGVGIFQRTAGKVARLLYAFKATIRLPRNLAFYATARRVIRADFARNLQRQVNDSFAHHG
jgi:hypothetical protein